MSGEVYQHIQYFPFGETFVEERTGTKYTPYLYNAKELDEETGLYYYGARYYDPRVSMFYGVDVLAEKYIGISSYAYVANNPMILVDPDGREIYAVLNKNNNTLYVTDLDHWKNGLPLQYATPDEYKVDGLYDADGNLSKNQVLVIKGVFTGGQSSPNGITRNSNDPNQLPLPNELYEILDFDRDGWLRLDAADSKPRNDRYDNSEVRNSQGELRGAFRAHKGSLSWGCLTFDINNEGAMKGFDVFNQILESTTTTQVRDNWGIRNRLGIGNNMITRFGYLRVKSDSYED